MVDLRKVERLDERPHVPRFEVAELVARVQRASAPANAIVVTIVGTSAGPRLPGAPGARGGDAWLITNSGRDAESGRTP